MQEYRKTQKVRKKSYRYEKIGRENGNNKWCHTILNTILLAWFWIILTVIAYILYKQRFTLYKITYYPHFFMLFFFSLY